MRRKDREITENNAVFDILNRCNTVRIGFSGEAYPYIVPVSFGAELKNGKPIVYFHCARHGMKLDLWKQNPRVCVEGDIFVQTETTAHGITTRYESVIGFGTCVLLSDREEILHGLRLLTDHYGYYDYPLDRCSGLDHVLVAKITLDEVSGKRNLPDSPVAADD